MRRLGADASGTPGLHAPGLPGGVPPPRRVAPIDAGGRVRGLGRDTPGARLSRAGAGSRVTRRSGGQALQDGFELDGVSGDERGLLCRETAAAMAAVLTPVSTRMLRAPTRRAARMSVRSPSPMTTASSTGTPARAAASRSRPGSGLPMTRSGSRPEASTSAATMAPAPAMRRPGMGNTGSRLVAAKKAPVRTASAATERRSCVSSKSTPTATASGPCARPSSEQGTVARPASAISLVRPGPPKTIVRRGAGERGPAPGRCRARTSGRARGRRARPSSAAAQGTRCDASASCW